MKNIFKVIPFKELILSQILSFVFIIVSWFILGLMFGRSMGIIYALHTIEQLPLIIIYGLIFFYNIDILTPNPIENEDISNLFKKTGNNKLLIKIRNSKIYKKISSIKFLKLIKNFFSGIHLYKIFGVILSETFEHLLMPVGIILIILVFPTEWYLYIIIYSYVTFGLVLGKIKKFKEVLQVFLMSFIFTITLFIPDFMKFLLVHYNIGFETSIPMLIIFPFCVYVSIKLLLFSGFFSFLGLSSSLRFFKFGNYKNTSSNSN